MNGQTSEHGETAAPRRRRDRNLLLLSAGVFLSALTFGIENTALPFLAISLGGGARESGLIGALGFLTYSFMLLITGQLGDRLSQKRLSTASLFVLGLCSAAYALTRTVPTVYGCTVFRAVTASLFWPPVMAWFSAGYEGQTLNRRLSYFNLSWCSGMIAGPFVGGHLFELAPRLPFWSALALRTFGALILLSAAAPQTVCRQHAQPARQTESNAPGVAWVFAFIAPLSHFTAYTAMGLMRYQLPVLAHSLGIDAGRFGSLITFLSLSMTLTFVFLGRSDRWHYKLAYLLTAQGALAFAMLCMTRMEADWQMLLTAVLVGHCVGITYTSNLFYGVSGRASRARRMAVHELLLGMGFGVGSLGGGMVNARFGLRAAYPVCAALIMAGGLAQLVLFLTRRTKSEHQ